MIWNSMVLMSVFDVFFITAACVALYYLIAHARAITEAGARRELILIGVGLAFWVLVYFADLLVMTVGPLFVSQREALATQRWVHQEMRWVTDAIAAGLILVAVVSIVRRFSTLVSAMQKNANALEVELDSRTNLQHELKAEALSQRASNRSKSEFLVGITHELRTPLNGIIGLAGLLANTDMNEDQKKLLATLEQSAQAMLARVNDVLDLSRLESGHVELRSIAFRPTELMNSVEALFSPLASEKDLTISTHASENARKHVIGDVLLIKQVLCNLVSNAVKFTPSGSIQIISDVTPAGADRVWLSFTVIDTGIGLSDEDVARLSQPGLEGQGGESGLGLSISWRLAQLMEGDLTIESEQRKGSAFTVRLQVQREPEPEAEDVVA